MPMIIDIKTGARQKVADCLQLFAYRQLEEENKGIETGESSTPGLKFLEDGHIYLMNGKCLPSVTQIIRRYFPVRFNSDETAAQKGVFIHKLCSQLVREGDINWGYLEDYYSDLVPYMEAFKGWFQQLPRKDSAISEVRMASPNYGYAGTLDIVIPKGNGLHNLYLKPDGQYVFVSRQREKYYNWNLFVSCLNVYKAQEKDGYI